MFWRRKLHFEKVVTIHLKKNVLHLHQRMLCAKFGWKWLSGSGEEDFYKFSMYLYYFPIISPLRRGWPFIRTNLNPLHQGILCAKLDCVEIDQWFRSRRFLKVVNFFLLFPNYIHFRKGVTLHLNKLETPSPRETLYQILLKLAQWFWRWRLKCEKITDGQTDRQTGDGRQLIRKAFSSGKLNTMVLLKKTMIPYRKL